MYLFTYNADIREPYEPGSRVHIQSTLKYGPVISLNYYVISSESTWVTCLYS